jgi:hypothetical protein
MPDDVTRDWARRMHYAAWRASTAATAREAGRWRRRYYDCRDRVVLGNLKLTFRAVQKWKPAAQFADDLTGECQVVLINAVAAYNPWLGIRFSTYAFTCLLRALSRLSQRQAADRLSRCVPLESLRGGGPSYGDPEELARSTDARVDEYLRPEHTLLTPREKDVLIRRYRLKTWGCRRSGSASSSSRRWASCGRPCWPRPPVLTGQPGRRRPPRPAMIEGDSCRNAYA